MRNILKFICHLAIVTVANFTVAQAQQKYILNGKITGLTEPTKLIFYYQPSKTEEKRDSVMVKDGHFHFEGKIDHPYFATIELKPPHQLQHFGKDNVLHQKQMRSFFITTGLTTIEGTTLQDAIIHNRVQDEFMAYKKSVKTFDDQILAINKALFKTDNMDSVAVLKERRAELDKQYINANAAFIRSHPESYLSFEIVKSYAVIIDDPVAFATMYDGLANSFKKSSEGKRIAQDLKMAKQLAIGRKAVPFSQTDVNGNLVSLVSLAGKYVLIDFWASWCGPCRAEYPFLKKAYANYKQKNFEIISISLDSKENLWKDAIKSNGFEWIQLCDLKGMQNALARTYGVSAIPQSFLIDPNGKIIAKNLRGENLLNKLEEVIR